MVVVSAYASALAGRPGAHHVIVDPDESTAWSGIGVTNLDRAASTSTNFAKNRRRSRYPDC